MLPLDLALAVAGRVAHEVGRWVDDSDRARWSIVAGLLVLSAIPMSFVGSSPRPTDLTFDDVRQGHIPAMTTWVRLEGDLREAQNGGGSLYELHDSRDDARYVVVIAADGPLPTGQTMVTGRISPNITTTGNVGTIDADVPAVPPVDEPIWLYLTPAVIAVVIALGIRTAYPVVRRERRWGVRAPMLSAGESLAVRWSGRIGSEAVPRYRPEACTIVVSSTPDVSYLTLTTKETPRTLRIRRPAYVERVRLCWVGHREPGLEVHGQNADLVLAFDDSATRDRLATTLR